jgi:hypothetical protein
VNATTAPSTLISVRRGISGGPARTSSLMPIVATSSPSAAEIAASSADSTKK